MPPARPPFQVQTHSAGDTVIVRFIGQDVILDEQNAQSFGQELFALAEGLGPADCSWTSGTWPP